jgi:SEC-C motif-containing protein
VQNTLEDTKPCPCHSGEIFQNCCQPLLKGAKPANTPEQMMRSRYTAYTLIDISYIERTMQGKALRSFNAKEARQWAQSVIWLNLQVIRTTQTDDRGTVEFIAQYSVAGTLQQMHELSQFKKIKGFWYYTDGETF